MKSRQIRKVEADAIYTLADVAAYLQVSVRTVRRLYASQKIRGIRVGNQIRFRLSDLAHYVEYGNQPTPKKAPGPRGRVLYRQTGSTVIDMTPWMGKTS